MASSFPETWGPYFLLSITRRGASAQTEVQFASMIDPSSLTITPGNRPAEGMPNGSGGRTYKEDPEEDLEISFDIIRGIELDTATAVGLFQQFVGVSGTTDPNAYDTGEPLATDTAWTAGANRTMDRFRIAVLRTNDSGAATAAGTTASNTEFKRFYAINCLFISMEENNSDNYPKYTVTFKCKPYNMAGTMKNYAWESGDDTPAVAFGSATGAYTSGAYTTALYPD